MTRILICETHRPLIKRRLNFNPEEIGDARERDLSIWTIMNSHKWLKKRGYFCTVQVSSPTARGGIPR
jgi:hypothetical protein